jgi:hypothetical protein
LSQSEAPFGQIIEVSHTLRFSFRRESKGIRELNENVDFKYHSPGNSDTKVHFPYQFPKFDLAVNEESLLQIFEVQLCVIYILRLAGRDCYPKGRFSAPR